MSKHTDISQQIRKYLNGELDARAMHSLERQAQDDPFIMDALEGYTKAGANQQANLTELNSRLQRLTKPTGATVINWRYISVAASVIVLLTVGIWYTNNQPEKGEKKLALQEKTKPEIPKAELPEGDSKAQTVIEQANPVVQIKPDNEVRIATNKRAGVGPRPAAPADETASPVITAQQKPADSASLEEMIVLNYNPLQQDKNAPVAPLADSVENALAGRQQGMLAQQENVKKDEASTSAIKASTNLSGKIMDAAGPIPGARVTVKGTPISAVTDVNGKFTLPVPPKRVVLDVNIIGYLNKQVKVNPKDPLVIDMKPAQALNGVITGYGTAPCCWDVYEKYLKDNAISPDDKTGTVKLSFTVNPDNSLTDFRIIKGLSDLTDQKAIDLVKNGPVWLHDSSGKPKTVTLRIKFAAKQ